jgi:N-acetylglucosaminyldiphosphoundecaprenol N-acetyl-beta-D-mannosaminyltransferase
MNPCRKDTFIQVNPMRAALSPNASRAPRVPYVSLYGAMLAAITERECVRVVMDELDAGCGGWLMTLNLDHLRRFVMDASYAATAARADMLVADGMPLIWASRLLKTPLPERVTGSNLIWSLSEGAAARGCSVFLLGGKNDAAQRSAEILQASYRTLKVAGVHAPPFGFEADAVAMEALFEAVCRAQPDIIYVALGSPKEDHLIAQLRARVPRAWCIGVGISFSWVAGQLPRAPLWMQQSGLEWLHRLAHEPRRLMRRYLIDDLPFAVRLFGDVLKQRLRRTPETEQP